ncbi:MAG: choice-of-anchor D domain-containing protein, partial [Candidatus Binataceae bacterium]
MALAAFLLMVMARSQALAALPGDFLKTQPSMVNFGRQPIAITSQAQIVTITNHQHERLTVSDIKVSNGFTATGSCGVLAPGASCTVSVTFTPNRIGEQFGFLTYRATDNDFDDFFSGGVALLLGRGFKPQEFAYVANSGSANVSAYVIDTTSGALFQINGSPFD